MATRQHVSRDRAAKPQGLIERAAGLVLSLVRTALGLVSGLFLVLGPLLAVLIIVLLVSLVIFFAADFLHLIGVEP